MKRIIYKENTPWIAIDNILNYLCLQCLNEEEWAWEYLANQLYIEEVYLQISVSQYRLMWTYKYNITQNKTRGMQTTYINVKCIHL